MRLALKISSLALALATALDAASLPEVTDNNYLTEVLNPPSAKHVLVGFVSKDCDCDSFQTLLEDIAPDYDSKLSIVSMNTDNCQVKPSVFNIQGPPALAMFFQGAYVGGLSGDQSKSQIKTFLRNNLPA
ncbi:hypothetical protein BG000_010608 [Podila horticola]|nr:hypothetical protein BG000_010608 [Podila horticola]